MSRIKRVSGSFEQQELLFEAREAGVLQRCAVSGAAGSLIREVDEHRSYFVTKSTRSAANMPWLL